MHDNVIGIKKVKHSNTQMCNCKNNKNKMTFQQWLNVLGDTILMYLLLVKKLQQSWTTDFMFVCVYINEFIISHYFYTALFGTRGEFETFIF